MPGNFNLYVSYDHSTFMQIFSCAGTLFNLCYLDKHNTYQNLFKYQRLTEDVSRECVDFAISKCELRSSSKIPWFKDFTEFIQILSLEFREIKLWECLPNSPYVHMYLFLQYGYLLLRGKVEWDGQNYLFYIVLFVSILTQASSPFV